MKRKLSNIGLILIFVIGFGVLIYPKVSSYYNEIVNSYSIDKYEEDIQKKDKVDLEGIFKKAEKYNNDLLKEESRIKTGESTDKEYLSQLKINEKEQIIGYITIDKINVRLPIYHGTSEPVLQRGVGHLEGTSLPIGGKGMHSALTGHTGLPSAELFSELEKLMVGDTFVVKILDRVLTYKINKIDVVLPKEVEGIRPIPGKDIVTLVTCTPYGVNSHRLLVHGERIENKEEEEAVILESNKKGNNRKYIILGIGISIIILIAYFIVKKIKRGKNLK